MDHAMSYLMDYMDFSVDTLINEWESKKYKKLSDCPSYGEVKAYCDAYNILASYYYAGNDFSRLTPKQFIDDYNNICR